MPYIITEAEKAVFLSLPNEVKRGKFIKRFWEKRDPQPLTSVNEFKIPYHKRISLANRLFGTAGTAGWRLNKGKIYILLGPPQEIQRDFNPTSTDFSVFHGTRLFQEGKYEEAIEYFKKAVGKFHNSVEANCNLALSHLRVGHIDEAIVYLENIIESEPNVVQVYLALGECYFTKEEDDKALATFSKALELQPNNTEVYYNIGIIYYKNDETEKAVHNFLTSRDLDSDFAGTYCQLGLAYIKKGEMDKAIENLESFLSVDPDSPQAGQVKALLEAIKKK